MLDPKPDYLYLSASTWDRMMLKRDQPQWYGAQHKHDENGKQIGVYPINEQPLPTRSVCASRSNPEHG